jgi:aqualysin 1
LSSITVGATDEDDRIAYFGVAPHPTTGAPYVYASNTGSCVDLFAPGLGLTATSRTGEIDYNWGGTSAAAPIVAGMAALALARFGAVSPGMVENYILQTAMKNVVQNSLQAGVAPMIDGTPNNLVYRIGPGKRRACCW